MSVPVLTAIQDPTWESRLVGALEGTELGVEVVRRCVDLADLLATAATGQAGAVLLSADLRRLDRDALARLAIARVAVIGVHPPGDDAAHDRLRQLGIAAVLPADAAPELVAETVLVAAGSRMAPLRGQRASFGDPRAALPEQPVDRLAALGSPGPGADGSGGQVIAVWGPTGAPGRTTLAIGLASEAATHGRRTLLVDADVYGGVVAQALGILDESAGVAAAARLANNGGLDVTALAGLARSLDGSLRVLTGIGRAERWPELRPAAIEALLDTARSLAEVTVVDCGFCLEQDEELSYDTAAPRRNGATLAVLECADTIVVVGSADPIGVQRLVRSLSDLREVVPDRTPVVVVNRLRASAVPGDAREEISSALARYAGVAEVAFVPLDVAGVDAAVVAGATLAEAAPGSPARRAMATLAARLLGLPPSRRSLLARRKRAAAPH